MGNKDIFQKFLRAEKFIKQWIEEISNGKKISVEEGFFYNFIVFLVLWHAVNFSLASKIVVSYVTKESTKLNPLQN